MRRRRRLPGERASASHYDGRKLDALLVHGCNYWDATAPAEPALESGSNSTWGDVERIWEYLWRDERIILRLVREGKTPTDVAEIMRLPNRFEARREIERVIRVVAFYVKWEGAIRGLCELSGKLSAEHKRVAILFGRWRKSAAEIAKRTGYETSTVYDLVRKRIPDALRAAGRSELAEFMEVCSSSGAKMLRIKLRRDAVDRRENMPEAWRNELRKYLLASLGKVWYEWAGQDLEKGEVDCSGLVIEVLKCFGVLPVGFKDTRAWGLSKYFRTVTDDPKPGDLAFYGSGKGDLPVTHVMFYVGDVDGHRNMVAGMCGGTIAMKADWARKVGAGLWLRTMRYRKDFLFCRRVM